MGLRKSSYTHIFLESEDQKYCVRMEYFTLIQNKGNQKKCLPCQVEDKYFQ